MGNATRYNKMDNDLTKYKFIDNDEIIMELNLNTKNISFYKNKKYLGIACKNIETGDNINYRLAVAMYDANDSVKLAYL